MRGNAEVRWFALRVFKNRLHLVKKQVEDDGYDTYQAMTVTDRIERGTISYKRVPLIPSLLFVKVDWPYVHMLKSERFDHVMVYGNPDGIPEPVSDAQMDLFILVTSPAGGHRVDYLPDGMLQYRKGDPVRVIDGFYKGATGVVRRIRKDRKLLVAIEGVAVVAVSNIPIHFLEKI